MSFSTFAQVIHVDIATSYNAVKKSVSTINGIKTFHVTIPFFSLVLDELNLITFDHTCSGTVMINVDGQNTNYTHSSKFRWFKVNNMQPGTRTFIVQSLCNGAIKSTQQIDVVIIKEPTPTLNLNISAQCAMEHGKYNGYIHLHASGSYTNAKKLYVQNTTTTGCVNSNKELASLGSQNLPNNTIYNAFIYKCNMNGIYNVKMEYRSLNLNGNIFSYVIPNGQYGWTDYSYRKRMSTCMNMMTLDPVLAFPLKSNNPNDGYTVSLSNPVKDELELFINSEEKANYDIEIYDFSGLSVKRANLKEADSNSKNTINVQDLRKGIYIVEIKNGDSVIREKMIKE